jgi:hypothetical protein
MRGIAILIMHAAGLSRLGFCVHCRLMAHLRERMGHRLLKIRVPEAFGSQSEGESGKGASKSTLGSDDWFVEGRQLKHLHVNGLINLADHDPGILGSNVEKNHATLDLINVGELQAGRICTYIEWTNPSGHF